MTFLSAPDSWRDATVEQREEMCNGCGPTGWKATACTDTIIGVDVREACCIHDWEYALGGWRVERFYADDRFHSNLNTLVRARGGWLLPARLIVAWWYYRAVSRLGGLYWPVHHTGPVPLLR